MVFSVFPVLLLFGGLVSSLKAQQSSLALEVVGLTKNAETDLWDFNAKVSSESRCMFGDLDAIMLDMRRNAGKSSLQLSLEPLQSKSYSIIVGTPPSKRGTGTEIGTFSVSVPNQEKPVVMGLFLCSVDIDSTYTQACRNQQLVSINHILRPHHVDVRKAIGADGVLRKAPPVQKRPSAAGNKSYFFRTVILEQGKLLVPTAEMNEDTYKALASYLKSKGADVSNYEQLLADIKNFGETLGSIPLKTGSDFVELILPYYDQKKCVGKK